MAEKANKIKTNKQTTKPLTSTARSYFRYKVSKQRILLDFYPSLPKRWGFPIASLVKNMPANAEDTGSIPGSGRSPGEGNGNPLQDSCVENPMDTGVWRATDHGVAKSRAGLVIEQGTHSNYCSNGKTKLQS